MIIINEKANNKIKDLNLNNFYIVIDFDQTITTKDSSTSLSLFSKSGFYDKSYLEKRNKNYEYFRPLELDPNISSEEKFQITKTWQEKSYELMLEYKVRESDIKRIIMKQELLKVRENAIDFIKTLNEYNIPLIINSAGCGNFIIELLKLNHCYSDNVYVHSNILEFKDDVIVDSITNIIHSMNKFDIDLPDSFYQRIKNKKYAILIGDQLSDANMARVLPKKDTLSFGFLESNIEEVKNLFYNEFDIVLKDNEGFNGISKILKLKR